MQRVNKATAIANLASVLATIGNFGENDTIQFVVSNGKLTVARVAARRPDPVFECMKTTVDKLKAGDIVYFEYTDLSWHTRTRRGAVTEITTDDVLIFDFEAEDHSTGQRGAYRRSKKMGITNVYKLTDYIPF